MPFNYKETASRIQTLLGEDNYKLVASEMDNLISEVTSLEENYHKANDESAKRRLEIKELEKGYEKFQDYEELKSKIESLESEVSTRDDKLKGFYEQRKNVLKDYASKFDVLNDEKFSKVSSRFKGLENLDNLDDHETIERYISDFELLSLNENEPAQRAPNPAKTEKQSEKGMFGY